MNELVGQIARDNQAFFDVRGVRLEVRTHADAIPLLADAARLMQAIGNLLHNAAKFSDPGATVMLTVALDRVAEQTVVTVTDDGCGIVSDLLPNLFQPFTQLNQHEGSSGGLGLGLSIVRQIAELHRGSVEAHSDGPGKGARFVLRLPLRDRAQIGTATGSAVGAWAAGSPTPVARPVGILLIEDDEDLQELTALRLRTLGHEVVVAGSGPEGIAAAKRERPDVILCDIGLPGMDGYAVAEAIRADATLREVRLVALTGYGRPGDIDRAREAGFDHHVTKPFAPDHLDTILAGLEVRGS